MSPSSVTALQSSSLKLWLLQQLQNHPALQQAQGTLERLLHGKAEAKSKTSQNETSNEVLWPGLENPTLKAVVLYNLLHHLKKPIVVVCPDPQSVMRLQATLEALLEKNEQKNPSEAPFAKEDVVRRYPTEFFSPYDLAVLPTPFLNEHYRFLEACQADQPPRLLLISARNLLARFPSYANRVALGLQLEQGQELAPETVMQHCLAMGYSKTGLVLEPGDVSRRGDIVDIYPLNAPPVRLSYFGDTIENLRQIDGESQRSIQAISKVTVLPRSTLVLTQEVKTQLAERLPEQLQAQSKHLGGSAELDSLTLTVANQIEGLEQHFLPDGLDYYAPLVACKNLNNEATPHDWQVLGDCLPKGCLLVLEDWLGLVNAVEALADRLKHQLEEGEQRGRLLHVGQPWHVSAEEALKALRQQPKLCLRLEPHALPEATKTEIEGKATGTVTLPSLNCLVLPRFQANLPGAIAQWGEWRREGYQVVVATDYPQRLLDSCKEADITADYWPDHSEKLPPTIQLLPNGELQGKPIVLTRNALPDGLFLPELKLLYMTDAELFGRHRSHRLAAEAKGKKKDDPEVIQNLSQLRNGDYVVHIKHGIGQFLELSQIKLDGQVREYLTLQYKGQDKLYVPVDQLNLLSRYRGAGDAKPTLSKIGGAEWKSVQRKVKSSLQTIAKELVALYAARQKVQGHAFEPDSPWQVELEEAFPFQETPDQWKAISDVKTDMEADRPMDRLICGDVGFGKTEVALRGLFKCVLSGKQAALLVPTTILAQQHFNTLVDRFQAYPVRVGLLSRFRSPKEQQELVERLRVGDVDVVVGTHRLLQKDIRFKDLGLLVIDEEHRFGVSHKEKMKQMRTHVDVLTMSATPIPRTLYMSLSGVREMSLINTPPVNRLPVQTFVGPKNPAQIRMALLHEVDRGGQVYYLHNRVETIYAVADELKTLVPEVRIAVAHGQLNPRDLEAVMLDFASQAFDVLVCTTIVESGVDIPNANTLVIDDSDRYGLAQLYQIRGRVGRSDVQAYAYLYYSPEKILTQDTQNRLRAIREFTALGSGYQIAMRDMEIRGVGNILGGEQHGHMIQVGFDMYCDLLNQAIDAAQQGLDAPEEKEEPSIIDLNVTALIPEKYVGSNDVKLNEYKRLAATISEKALDVIEAEWQDRFGPVPEPTKRLLQLTRLRIQASEMNIPFVRADDEALRISVPYSLQEWMKLQQELPPQLGKKLRWVAGVRSMESSNPNLICKHMGMSAGDQVDFVAELFKNLKRIQAKFLAGLKK